MARLPEDILAIILGYLPVNVLNLVAQVSKHWHMLSQAEWQKRLRGSPSQLLAWQSVPLVEAALEEQLVPYSQLYATALRERQRWFLLRHLQEVYVQGQEKNLVDSCLIPLIGEAREILVLMYNLLQDVIGRPCLIVAALGPLRLAYPPLQDISIQYMHLDKRLDYYGLLTACVYHRLPLLKLVKLAGRMKREGIKILPLVDLTVDIANTYDLPLAVAEYLAAFIFS